MFFPPFFTSHADSRRLHSPQMFHTTTGILAEDAVNESLPEAVPRLSSIPKPWLALGAAVLAGVGGGTPEQFTPLAYIDNPELDTQVQVWTVMRVAIGGLYWNVCGVITGGTSVIEMCAVVPPHFTSWFTGPFFHEPGYLLAAIINSIIIGYSLLLLVTL